MTPADLAALSPILFLGALCIVVMLCIALRRHHMTIALLSAASCLCSAAMIPWAAAVAPHSVTMLLIVDRAALLYMGLLLASTVVVIALSYGYLAQHVKEHEEFEEFYLLLLIATFGGLVLAAAAHFASLFLGLELMGVSLYSLIGYVRSRRGALEAAVKYLMLSASATAFLLLGMAILYFDSGRMTFRIFDTFASITPTGFTVEGVVLILVGVGFKLGLAPFHMWIPDVYQGAPAPITAYVATVSKGAVFALLIRFVQEMHLLESDTFPYLLGLLAALSMTAGNGLALLQRNIKRLLAYSSIAHFGYLLVALLAGGPLAAEAATFYLIAYIIMTLGVFGVVAMCSIPQRDAEELDDYRGLFWAHPWLASTFMLSLLSLAGIPVTAGFIGKFYAVAAGVDAELWVLVLLLIANSVIGLFYYLRIIVTLFDEGALEPAWSVSLSVAKTGWTATVLALGLVASLLLWLGNYPEPAIQLIRSSMSQLVTTIAEGSE